MPIHNRFRNAEVLDVWTWEGGRTCLLIQGAGEPPLAIFDEQDGDAVLELVPPAGVVARLAELVADGRASRRERAPAGTLE